MLIAAIARNLDAGHPAPEEEEDLTFPVDAGQPLAQALWVGPRLRWVEQLSIASYLRNGWRYQLYVYDIPQNVPEGCEILDAEAILPRAKLFREGGSSGVHAGSLGAFSRSVPLCAAGPSRRALDRHRRREPAGGSSRTGNRSSRPS